MDVRTSGARHELNRGMLDLGARIVAANQWRPEWDNLPPPGEVDRGFNVYTPGLYRSIVGALIDRLIPAGAKGDRVK